MTDRLHILISGRVQGVGFRYGAHARALELGLTGWVRNLSDGRVEGEFEGSRAALEEMLAWCKRGPGFSRVDKVDATWHEATATYDQFEVRR